MRKDRLISAGQSKKAKVMKHYKSNVRGQRARQTENVTEECDANKQRARCKMNSNATSQFSDALDTDELTSKNNPAVRREVKRIFEESVAKYKKQLWQTLFPIAQLYYRRRYMRFPLQLGLLIMAMATM